jgi:hypothetical protein
MYPLGAQSVKCSMCHNVTQVNPAAAPPPGATSQPMQPGGGGPVPAPQQQQQQQQRPPTQTVVVENPPTLNEQGAEVSSGLWCDPAPDVQTHPSQTETVT